MPKNNPKAYSSGNSHMPGHSADNADKPGHVSADEKGYTKKSTPDLGAHVKDASGSLARSTMETSKFKGGNVTTKAKKATNFSKP